MSTTELRDLLGGHADLAEQLLAELRDDRSRLPVLFPGLPRRFGKDPIGGGRREFGDAIVDLDAFRTCDLACGWALFVFWQQRDGEQHGRSFL